MQAVESIMFPVLNFSIFFKKPETVRPVEFFCNVAGIGKELFIPEADAVGIGNIASVIDFFDIRP